MNHMIASIYCLERVFKLFRKKKPRQSLEELRLVGRVSVWVPKREMHKKRTLDLCRRSFSLFS